MTERLKILIASHRPMIDWTAHQSQAAHHNWQIIGVVNPRVGVGIGDSAPDADILMIEADDLIWLLNNKPTAWAALRRRMRPMVMLDNRQLLDIGSRADEDWGLLLRKNGDELPLGELAIALDGHIVIGARLLRDLLDDRLRREVLPSLTPLERNVLAELGSTFSNRALGARTGLSEARIKAVVYHLSHKLRLPNRTAVAVFAIKNGLAPSAEPESDTA